MKTILLALAAAAVATSAAAQPMTCAATRDDQQRLSRLPQAWDQARRDVVDDGRSVALRRLGFLAEPDVRLNRPQPTPGRYQCRTVKLGAARPGMLPFIAYGWFRCEVTLTPGGDLILTKTTGSQRTRGLICPDDDPRRARYVGVLQLGQETRWPAYGEDPQRDMIGEVRRIGPERWRVALPWPAFESKLDLLELRRVR